MHALLLICTGLLLASCGSQGNGHASATSQPPPKAIPEPLYGDVLPYPVSNG